VTSCTNIPNRETERAGRRRGEGDKDGGIERQLESSGRNWEQTVTSRTIRKRL